MIELLAYRSRRWGWQTICNTCPGCFALRHDMRRRFDRYGEHRDHCRQCGTQWRVCMIEPSRRRCAECRRPLHRNYGRHEKTCGDCLLDSVFAECGTKAEALTRAVMGDPR